MKVIILVGNIGSGKSSLSALLKPTYEIVNQDNIGNRKDCMNIMRRHLQQGKNALIDRTNISREQRAYFLNIAKDYRAEVSCVLFQIPVVECIKRVKARKEHKTIPFGTPDAKIEEIVKKFSDSYEAPDYLEGFENIYSVTSDTDLSDLVIRLTTTSEESIKNRNS